MNCCLKLGRQIRSAAKLLIPFPFIVSRPAASMISSLGPLSARSCILLGLVTAVQGSFVACELSSTCSVPPLHGNPPITESPMHFAPREQ